MVSVTILIMIFLAVRHGAQEWRNALSITRSLRLDKAGTDTIVFVTNDNVHEIDRAGVVPLVPCRFVLPLL